MTQSVKLAASCVLRDVAPLQRLLLTVQDVAEPVLMDGAEVEHIDTAGLQLLACFVRRRVRAGKALHWRAVSPELLRCSRRLGLVEALGLPAPGASGTPA